MVKIGDVDRLTAPIMVHEGAVYLHEGRQYLIKEMDWEKGLAEARRIRVNYYTEASSKTEAHIQEVYEKADAGACRKSVGWVLITQQATEYRKIRRYSHAVLGKEPIHLPPQQFETMAYWITLQPQITRRLEEANILLDALRSLGDAEGDPLTSPRIIDKAVKIGLLDAPHLAGNPHAAGKVRTACVDGAIRAVDPDTGEPVSERARVEAALSDASGI